MRVYLRSAAIALFLMVVAPAPASADLMAFFDYLDQLSGPGPFGGAGVEAQLLCVNSTGPISLRKCVLPWGIPSTDFNRVEIGPHISWMKGGVNDDLIYPADTTPEQKQVNILTYGAQMNVNFRPRIGATVRVTGYRFTGPLVRDRSQTSAAVGFGPVFKLPFISRTHAAVTPLVLVGLGPFTAEDFGATGPPLDSDKVKLIVRVAIGL